jgi:hypothetical protein
MLLIIRAFLASQGSELRPLVFPRFFPRCPNMAKTATGWSLRTPSAGSQGAPLANFSLILLDLEGAVLSSAEFFANG